MFLLSNKHIMKNYVSLYHFYISDIHLQFDDNDSETQLLIICVMIYTVFSSKQDHNFKYWHNDLL